jgi:ParB family chromosome partitioning protein
MIQFDDLKDFDVPALKRDAPAASGAPPCELQIDKIYPDPDNIRKDCPQATIEALATTIRADGLLQAITVRKHPERPGSFVISYGERRWRAVRLLACRPSPRSSTSNSTLIARRSRTCSARI